MLKYEEQGAWVRNSNPLRDLNDKNIASGIVAALLVLTGPPAIILEAAAKGNFTVEQTIYWMFAVYVFGGILSILLPLYYRMPITAGHSITGVAFLATVTSQFGYHELIGSYMFAALLIFLTGYFGIFSKLLQYVPKQIIAAMLAGMITQYMVNFVVSISQIPIIGGLALVAYLVFNKWDRRVPPMVAAIAVAFVLLFLTQPLKVNSLETSFILPTIQLPEFNMLSFLTVSIPLALLILSNDAAVGLGALEQNDFKPPINRVVTYSGIFSLLANFFGGQSANIAGMMSAICSDEAAGPREKRYMGSVVAGIISVFFGLFSWYLVPVIQSLPKVFDSILVGFALLGVFGNSLYTGFSKPTMKISAGFAFVISASNISLFHISAPAWALFIGTILARYAENN
ncbi:benzoate/H(+) symporter BenE family transporter [Desulfosporosinus sp. PR]|uniref:benzoate/H(+) symporter BenE family transporter n=1 Tax=Candidatus Desulfosporosinus nitrosoreducens TaxID=3401928 RepID=UPI0027EF299A|nr:benzoate/H(+) symporter BenE family transporter [Desulfosporosinus sp. PR]MDQ7092981.1 benzoate/H(+) symporter BenE family transporter [Desulfosporosinus sp. PR]